MQVINSLGNGSNGSHFIITNSTVDFSNNTSHGLSTGILTVTDSTITANNNGLTGIIFNNTATFKNSNVTITGTKGTSYWNAGMRALSSNASCTIDADCTFRITDNYVSGIFLDASTSLTIAEGADVLVVRNEAMQKNCSTSKDLAKSGGGIVVRSGATATLSSTTQIYNNHAALAGDDIYLESDTSSITFFNTESTWALDGTYLDGSTHCDHMIDGWYNDGYTDGESSDRWEADAADTNDNYISLYSFSENESVTASGILALKAAHGIDAVDSEKKESVPDLDKTILTEDGETDKISVNAGETVTFQLESTLPSCEEFVKLISYEPDEGSDENWVIPVGKVGTDKNGDPYTYIITIHDQMDDSLILDVDSFEYTLVVREVVIDEGTGALRTTGNSKTVDISDYVTLNEEPGDDCTFELSIDILELYADGVITEADFGWGSIRVTYEATLSEEASAAAYYNNAWVVYPDGTSETDIVEVDTYGIKIFKYDQADESDDNGLSGATFKLYQEKTETTESNANLIVATLEAEGSEDVAGELADGGSDEIMVLATAAEDLTADDLEADYDLVDTLTTGSDGYVTIEGLAAGTYYLVETQAPDGYVKADTVLVITIPDDVNADTYLASVEFANAPIPSTGGMGTTPFKAVGMSLLLAAGVVYAFTLKRKKEEV